MSENDIAPDFRHRARAGGDKSDAPAGGQTPTAPDVVKSAPGEAADAAKPENAVDEVKERLAERLLTWTPSLLPIAEKLALAVKHDVTILLTGETGTGKTHLARMIHDLSPRSHERFVTVPCGAISPQLIESEFFGHVKGAFTGADRAKIGKFAAAGSGTLLLDEVDALGLEQQANLLRVVENGDYEQVGGTETLRSTCRLIVASNRDLNEEVAEGRFRQDLYYRFHVMAFHLPSLRERREDIPFLADGIARRFAAKFDKTLTAIHPETMSLVQGHSWPGNIRELENALQQAVLVCRGAELLPEHMPETLRRTCHNVDGLVAHPLASLTYNREVVERNVILRALAKHGNNRAKAAEELGISRVTLYKKMRKYGLMHERTRRAFA
jgi:DNA-binding NtrC family response regulator